MNINENLQAKHIELEDKINQLKEKAAQELQEIKTSYDQQLI